MALGEILGLGLFDLCLERLGSRLDLGSEVVSNGKVVTGESVAHEHCDSHGTNTAGNGSNGLGDYRVRMRYGEFG